MIGTLVLAGFTALFCMVAKRLERTIITAPMLYLGLGFLFSRFGLFPPGEAESVLDLVAEIALVLLLFLDAAQIDLSVLRRRHVWPARMLLIGLPLSIILGAAAVYLLLPGLPVFAVLLIAAILSPTDAALGQAVVANTEVPARPRRALIIESGLNDGIALPVILLFASLTASSAAADGQFWILFGVKQLTLGPLVGLVVGYLGGALLIWAKDTKSTSESYEGVGAVAMAGASYLGAVAVGGNGFIGAFTAGLAFGYRVKGRCPFVYEFTEGDGQILSWGAFFLIGIALVPDAVSHLSWPIVGLIVVSLSVVRPLAVWFSLLGTDASPVTRLFFGWFGPRGLATALFAMLVIPFVDTEIGDAVLTIAVNAVWISALLHGVTASPGSRWYARRIERMGACAEAIPIAEPAIPIPGM